MPLLLLFLLLLGLTFLPAWWVKRVLRRYDSPREDFPGTGGELARHLLDHMDMQYVAVECHAALNAYDPEAKVVYLGKRYHEGCSLTAIVVAAHEVGHALQDKIGYQPLQNRTRMVKNAQTLEKIGAGMMLSLPVITLFLRIPAASEMMLIGGLLSLSAASVVHLITLPVEFDASFQRALPILSEGGYLSPEDLPAARKILRACAYTYVAATLLSLLNLSRWLAVLRR